MSTIWCSDEVWQSYCWPYKNAPIPENWNLDFVLFHFSASSLEVKLTAPNRVLEHQNFKLNCSSDDVPEGHTAEFLEDGGTLTNIRIHKNKCFTTLAGATCQPRVCECSKDKRSYVVYHQLTKQSPNQTFLCKMTLADNVVAISNPVTVSLLGIILFLVVLISRYNHNENLFFRGEGGYILLSLSFNY